MIAGPCVLCGDTHYALSVGGPGICPSCDCGDFGLKKVQRQAQVILELRKALQKLTCPDCAHPNCLLARAVVQGERVEWPA